MGKKSPKIRTNWKSRALAAETLYEDLRRKYDAKTVTVAVADPSGKSVVDVPNTGFIQIDVDVKDVEITGSDTVSLTLSTDVSTGARSNG